MADRPLPLGPTLEDGTTVRVWPGGRPGRSAITRTMGGVLTLGGVRGVCVLPSADSAGRKVPGGFYAITHVEVSDG